jgi:hypothetical protein
MCSRGWTWLTPKELYWTAIRKLGSTLKNLQLFVYLYPKETEVAGFNAPTISPNLCLQCLRITSFVGIHQIISYPFVSSMNPDCLSNISLSYVHLTHRDLATLLLEPLKLRFVLI